MAEASVTARARRCPWRRATQMAAPPKNTTARGGAPLRAVTLTGLFFRERFQGFFKCSLSRWKASRPAW